MDKHQVEKLVRTLHRTTAELGDGATDTEWNALYQKVREALSLARDLEEEDVRRKWKEATEALSAELVRLDLTALEYATAFEGEGLEDGSYMIMLGYDGVVSLRKTLAGLEQKGRGLRVDCPEYHLSDGRIAAVWNDGYLHVWNRPDYDPLGEPDEVVAPYDWCDILSEPRVEAHREALRAKRDEDSTN